MFTQECDKRIVKGYSNLSSKEEGRIVCRDNMTADEVILSVTGSDGWIYDFNRNPAKVKNK